MKLIFTGKRRGCTYGCIYKVGDDLRQDTIVLQLVRVMATIWANHSLDLRLITFRVMPTGQRKGLIELVPDCRTLREIQTELSEIDNILLTTIPHGEEGQFV